MTSNADSEVGANIEVDEPAPSVLSSTKTFEGGSCPTDLFDEGEELAQIMNYAIKKAALKALSKHVPGESPLKVLCSAFAPQSRLQPSLTYCNS
jgi:hypothetical protein